MSDKDETGPVKDDELDTAQGGSFLGSVGEFAKVAGQEYGHYMSKASGFALDAVGGTRDIKMRETLPNFVDGLTGRK
ncbi:hypothetical protein ACLBXM_19055 [Xanthobacteraceae bacterium A53D]